jgi:hypothetical protein
MRTGHTGAKCTSKESRSIQQGVSVVRVHNVAEIRDVRRRPFCGLRLVGVVVYRIFIPVFDFGIHDLTIIAVPFPRLELV